MCKLLVFFHVCPRDGASNAHNFTDPEIASKEDFKPKDDVDTAHNPTGESTVQPDMNHSAAFISQAPSGCTLCCCEPHHKLCLAAARPAQPKLADPLPLFLSINAHTDADEDRYLDCAGPQMAWQQDHDPFLTACVSLQTTLDQPDEATTPVGNSPPTHEDLLMTNVSGDTPLNHQGSPC